VTPPEHVASYRNTPTMVPTHPSIGRTRRSGCRSPCDPVRTGVNIDKIAPYRGSQSQSRAIGGSKALLEGERTLSLPGGAGDPEVVQEGCSRRSGNFALEDQRELPPAALCAACAACASCWTTSSGTGSNFYLDGGRRALARRLYEPAFQAQIPPASSGVLIATVKDPSTKPRKTF
jgi:hypothetical protein